MIPSGRPYLRAAAAATLVFLVAIWVGGGIAVDAVAIPVALQALPRDRFAEFGAALFKRLNFVESLLGAVTVLLSFALGRRGWGANWKHVLATGLLAGMTALVLAFLLWLTPAMLGHYEEMRQSVNLANPNALPPARQSFRDLHTLYAALDVGKLLAGAVVLWLLATRRGR